MSATKAQALAVALDHCEETGEVTPELLKRAAELLARHGQRVAYGWCRTSAARLVRYSTALSVVARAAQHSSGYAANVFLSPSSLDGPEAVLQTEQAAMDWCDHELAAEGWVLLDRSRLDYVDGAT